MPKKWIDPLKEANATKVALNSGIKSYKQVAAENGMDWREQIDDMAEVLEYASEKGIGTRRPGKQWRGRRCQQW